MVAAHERQLVIVSNRLPIVMQREQDEVTISSGSGGLVTALAPVLRDRRGIWIGWAGDGYDQTCDAALAQASAEIGFNLKPVALSARDIALYYHGMANEILWPLLHDLQSRCNFDPSYWVCYQEVNAHFAAVIAENVDVDDYVWVHDYHLLDVGRELRQMRPELLQGFFLHIPFPCPDIYLKLPWRQELIEAMLAYDLIGFQTYRDRQNFIQCVRSLLHGVVVTGKASVVELSYQGRGIKIGHFPISIDYHYFVRNAATKEVADSAWFIHENIPDSKIMLGIDRLDYTKGIPERLQSFALALENHPELIGAITFIQVVIPSRINIPEYQQMQNDIEQLVSQINGRFTRSGWVPIHYLFRSLSAWQLLGYYRTAEIALVTPLNDGMNLVAKEYCASSIEQDGVLILSEFAGAAAQMRPHALIVNPYDRQAVADAIWQAFEMPLAERNQRMRKMRAGIRRHDIFWWVDSFLRAAFTDDLQSFPPVER